MKDATQRADVPAPLQDQGSTEAQLLVAVQAAASDARCRNCEAVTTGDYCAGCGQRAGLHRPTVADLVGDIVRFVFRMDSKFLRTLRELLRPGAATLHYLEGRRERFEKPFRLFVVLNVIYFFALGATPATVFEVTDQALPDGGRYLRVDFGVTTVGQTLDAEEARAGAQGEPITADGLKAKWASTGQKLALAMVPLLALVLRLLYARRDFVFAEHFVFALHVNAFSILAHLPARLTGSKPALVLAGVVEVVYLVLAMRAVYGGGRWSTAWRVIFALIAVWTASGAIYMALMRRWMGLS